MNLNFTNRLATMTQPRWTPSRLGAAGLLLTLALGGCGQMGVLYQPPAENESEQNLSGSGERQ